ncbi:MAG: hypothetical protein JW918_13570, partial [Anaerolineae bacterium]|nr:hypothetical protein [Anaerolineae bacterium]
MDLVLNLAKVPKWITANAILGKRKHFAGTCSQTFAKLPDYENFQMTSQGGARKEHTPVTFLWLLAYNRCIVSTQAIRPSNGPRSKKGEMGG